MSILDICALEMKRKRREFNPRALFVIVPLLITFIALFGLVLVLQYQNPTPVFTLLTDSDSVERYADSSLFTEQIKGVTSEQAILVIADGTPLQIISEVSLAQRAAASSFRDLLRETNLATLETQGYVYPVLLNISERFREEIITDQLGSPLSANGSRSNNFGERGIAGTPENPVQTNDQISLGNNSSFSQGDSSGDRVLLFSQNDQDPLLSELSSPLVAVANSSVDQLAIEEYSGINDLDTLKHVNHVFVAIEVMVILNFFSILYASSLFAEKIKKQCSLLFVSPIRPSHILIGKMLPYYAMSLVLITLILLVNGISLRFLPAALLVSAILSLLYFAVAYTSSVFSRSQKEFSFLSVFFISIISLYLIIPAFVANFSLVSNASLLTPLVLFSQGISIDYSVLFFLSIIYTLVSFWIFFMGSRLFTFEHFFSLDKMFAKVHLMTALYVKKFWHAAIFAFMVIPIAWLIEVVLIVFLLVLNAPWLLYVVIVCAAIIEELLRNLPAHAYFSTRKMTAGKVALFSLASGVGFGLAEKLLLYIMVAPFIQGYEALVLGTIFIPLLLHSLLTGIFLVFYRFAPFKHYWILCSIVGLIHAFINIFLIEVIT